MMEIEEKTVNADGTVEAFIVKADAGDLCRLCANTDNQLIPIYRGEGLEHHISVKIEKHLPIIKVTEVDKLPLQICYQCASTLISWHNLYEGCLVADKRLREILAIDEKLCPEDESFGDYVDDYRDNYDDDTHETLPTSTNSSNVEANTSKDNSTVIPILSDTKVLNETDLEASDERYAKSTLPPLRMPSSSTPPPPPTSLPSSSPLLSSLLTSSSLPARKTEHDVGETQADDSTLGDAQYDGESLKCNFCPMVFVTKADIAQHLSSSHAIGGGGSTKAARKRTRSLPPATGTKASRQKVAKKANDVSVAVSDDDDDQDDHNKNTSRRGTPGKKSYKCKICSKVCLSDRGLNRHSSVHKKTEPKVKCEYCNMTFESNEVKLEHVSNYHRIAVPHDGTKDKSDTHTADGGSTSFNDPMQNTICEISVKEDDEKENYVDESIANDDDDDKNLPGKEGEDKSTKKSGSSRRAPKKKTTEGESLSCKQCSKTFETKSGYGRHMNAAHNPADGEFACQICHKNFSSQTVLKRHNNNVHRTKKSKEPDAEDPFNKWYVFADGQKHLKCDQCKYNSLWYHKGRFLEHYRIHTGEKPFTCDLCGKQFRTKTLLQKHVMFVHEGIKEHPCDICGRCFSDKRYMEDHRRIHTGERPYVCDLCGKTFKQSASLFIHKELHKGLRKHACDLCGKRFTTRSSLTIHIKRHIGERNFICATCGKAFVDGKHLKDHMAVHSDERPFSCELCGGKFKLMKHLKQHGRTHKRDYVA